tara:strand:+ start:69633 stop:71303 length:1671 start_codon:yes stop_codon:yes gene_type:complete
MLLGGGLMMNGPRRSSKIFNRTNRQRLLQFSFWSVLTLLIAFIASTYIVDGKTQQSAYGDDWDDLGDFRSEINSMGVRTTAMVSSPLLLSEIDNPEETVFVVSGVERDTISLPRFTDDESIVELSDSDGYTGSEIEAIVEYVQAGGTLLLMDDFGYSSALAQEYNIVFSNHQLYDGEAWARELDYNYVWTNVTNAYNLTQTSGSTSVYHPCLADRDADLILDLIDPDPDSQNVGFTPTDDSFGMCGHRWDSEQKTYDFSESYDLLTSKPSAFDKESSFSPAENRYPIITSTLDSYLDSNDDGDLTPAFEAAGIQGDEQGPFAVYARICSSRLCAEPSSGQVHIASDGSLLINAIYSSSNIDGSNVPDNDNRIWALDIIADALLIGNGSLKPSENAVVIFDESRHQQTNPLSDTYNLAYYFLVYFTNDWMAMLILFLALFMMLEVVLIRKEDPEDWRHVFRIIYYGFGDAKRYEFYQHPEKIRQVFLSKIRSTNTMTREEFDSLSSEELQTLVDDQVLLRFIYDNRKYKTQELVAIVKRMREWGPDDNEPDEDLMDM